MKTFGRIAICGAISQYNLTGPRSQGIVHLHVGGLDRFTDLWMGRGWLSCLHVLGGVWQFPQKEKEAWLLPPSGHTCSLIGFFHFSCALYLSLPHFSILKSLPPSPLYSQGSKCSMSWKPYALCFCVVRDPVWASVTRWMADTKQSPVLQLLTSGLLSIIRMIGLFETPEEEEGEEKGIVGSLIRIWVTTEQLHTSSILGLMCE